MSLLIDLIPVNLKIDPRDYEVCALFTKPDRRIKISTRPRGLAATKYQVHELHLHVLVMFLQVIAV